MTSRLNLKVVSLILGLVLWVYVNIVISPVVRRTVACTIELKNKPSLMNVISARDTAQVTLMGTRRDFIFAEKDSIKAVVDLYNLRPVASVSLPIKIITPSGLSVVAMYPSQIEVTAEAFIFREMEIVPEIKGQPSDGFVLETPILTRKQVKLEGSPEIVNSIATCKATIFLQDIKNSISDNYPIEPLDGLGNLVKNVRMFPSTVNITIPIKEGYPTQSVQVIPQLINKLPEGLKLEECEASPSEILIGGPFRVLQNLKNIRTNPIDLSVIHASGTIISSLKAPFESVQILGSPTVSVRIGISLFSVTRNFGGIPLTLIKNPQQDCLVTPASCTLIAKGLTPSLDEVSLLNQTIKLDTTKMLPGTHSVLLKEIIHLPKGVEVLELIPSRVIVQIFPIIASASESTPPK